MGDDDEDMELLLASGGGEFRGCPSMHWQHITQRDRGDACAVTGALYPPVLPSRMAGVGRCCTSIVYCLFHVVCIHVLLNRDQKH